MCEKLPNMTVVLLDGSCQLPRDMLGNKGFGINAMRSLGLPVPPAYCLTTELCVSGLAGSWSDVVESLSWLEHETGDTFGHGRDRCY